MADSNPGELNPKVGTVEGTQKFTAPTTGTTGTREDCEVIDIADLGKTLAAPDLSATNWSAENPYDAPTFNDLRPN